MAYRYGNLDSLKKALSTKGVDITKLDFSKAVYINRRTKLCLICREKDENGVEHGEFWQTPKNLLNGKCCPKCGNNKKGQAKKLTNEQFLEKAKKIHGNKYNYSKVDYKNSKTKVCVICPEHGEFLVVPSSHIGCKKQGCPECAKKKLSDERKYPFEDFIIKANKIHKNKYSYVEKTYRGLKNKMLIICPEHGEFYQRPIDHLNGCGCPKCKYESNADLKRKKVDDFIKQAIKIHGDKYDYSKVKYMNNRTKVCIICHKHGEFWVTPGNHLKGDGCKECRYSVMETKFETLLKENSIEYVHSANYTILPFLKKQHIDFYIPLIKLAIEIQGGEHFFPVGKFGWVNGYNGTINRDDRKNKLCRENGITLIYLCNKKEFKEREIYNKNNTFFNGNDIIDFIKNCIFTKINNNE